MRPWNDPRKDIARKASVQPELFLVAVEGDRLVGTAMAGYDGHRGWLYYVAVKPDASGRGIGRALVFDAEAKLLALGCPKINILVRDGNVAAAEFWSRLGYTADASASLGRRLVDD
ncbi:GNAT family acetyltransferase [Herbiconiux sp. L3-i23]|nr:GNAT family acetyltransferase [Herbiconiux sp. L3-i23]